MKELKKIPEAPQHLKRRNQLLPHYPHEQWKTFIFDPANEEIILDEIFPQ